MAFKARHLSVGTMRFLSWVPFLCTALSVTVSNCQIRQGAHYITKEWKFLTKTEHSGMMQTRVKEGFLLYGSPEYQNLLNTQKHPLGTDSALRPGLKSLQEVVKLASLSPINVGGSGDTGVKSGAPTVVLTKRDATKGRRRRSADGFSSWKIFNSLSPSRFFSSNQNLKNGEPTPTEESERRKKRSTSSGVTLDMNDFGIEGPTSPSNEPDFINKRSTENFMSNLHYYVLPIEFEFLNKIGNDGPVSVHYFIQPMDVEEPVNRGMDMVDYLSRLLYGYRQRRDAEMSGFRNRRGTDDNLTRHPRQTRCTNDSLKQYRRLRRYAHDNLKQHHRQRRCAHDNLKQYSRQRRCTNDNLKQHHRQRRCTHGNLKQYSRQRRDIDVKEPKITSWSTSGAGYEGRRKRRSLDFHNLPSFMYLFERKRS